ncbi:flagellar hook-length control protein [Ammonifex degensii KC4]|uniref:Flagellar hook-length control protein n=1 Tax=Ammonifex degensii (strain DSM 10501 / KC4) TaxID=429009 RepID=C9R9Y8_AMMDK|nr:flagellar hook-length control protein FliK [Ammonifex degensii]ACX53117.1 flagellar hook-length control protein [Ammonifex degensii KC4]
MATPPITASSFPEPGLSLQLPTGGKGGEDFASLLSALLLALFFPGLPAMNFQAGELAPVGEDKPADFLSPAFAGEKKLPTGNVIQQPPAEPKTCILGFSFQGAPQGFPGARELGPHIAGSSLKGALQSFLQEKPAAEETELSADKVPAPNCPLQPEATTAPVLKLLDSQLPPLKSNLAPFSLPSLQPQPKELYAAAPVTPSPAAEEGSKTQDLPGAVKEVGRVEKQSSSWAGFPTLGGAVERVVLDKPCELHQLPQRLTQEIVTHVTSWRREGETLQLELKLEPPELGRIVAHLTFAKGNLRLHFWAPEAGIREIILHTLPELQQQLMRVGVELGEVAVLVGTGSGDLPREGSEPNRPPSPRALAFELTRREEEQEKGLSYWA